MIYITGDTHGDWMSRLNTKAFPEQKEMTKDDYVIVLGDFGIWNCSKSENYNLDWLEKKPFTTLFISGNHDNYDILDELPFQMWHGGSVNFIRPSVIHLMRGEVFTIDNIKFFCFGGASSHDIDDGILEAGDSRIKKWSKDYSKLFRVNHISWWERELPNKAEMEKGLRNLANNGNKVDYILTHSPYDNLLKKIDEKEEMYNSDVLTNYLQDIKEIVDYKQWIFGHMHVNYNFKYDRASCIYDQVIKLM